MQTKQKYHNKRESRYDGGGGGNLMRNVSLSFKKQNKIKSCSQKGMVNTDCGKYVDNSKVILAVQIVIISNIEIKIN